jgi:hypothetical protein
MATEEGYEMQVYFKIEHADTAHSVNGSNHIVPLLWASSGAGAPFLSRDCGTERELNHVIEGMIRDLQTLKAEGVKHFARLDKQRQNHMDALKL